MCLRQSSESEWDIKDYGTRSWEVGGVLPWSDIEDSSEGGKDHLKANQT